MWVWWVIFEQNVANGKNHQNLRNSLRCLFIAVFYLNDDEHPQNQIEMYFDTLFQEILTKMSLWYFFCVCNGIKFYKY